MIGREKTCLFPDAQTHGVWESKRLQILPNNTYVGRRDVKDFMAESCVQNLILPSIMHSNCRPSETDLHFATHPMEDPQAPIHRDLAA